MCHSSSSIASGPSKVDNAMTGPGKSFAAFGCVTLLAIGNPSIAHAQFGALTPEEIAEAIDLGTSKEPGPYMMPSVRGGGIVGTVFALAYTPFLRVQFAANKTWINTGRRLTPGEIGPGVLAPVVHLAMWRPDEWEGPECVVKPARVEVFRKGAGSPHRVPWKAPPAPGIPPLWVKDGLDTLAEYGALRFNQDGRFNGPQPWPLWKNGRWMIVAYPREFLRSDLSFFLTQGDGGSGSCILEGNIPSDLLATWR